MDAVVEEPIDDGPDEVRHDDVFVSFPDEFSVVDRLVVVVEQDQAGDGGEQGHCKFGDQEQDSSNTPSCKPTSGT